MNRRMLIVDDEKLIVKGLKYGFMQDEMDVDVAYDGEEALEKIQNNQYAVILLDLMLPKISGMDVCQMVREFSDVPIIMLTAKDDDMDKIMGFEYGADDYITKPFKILEVKARVKALIRRYEGAKRRSSDHTEFIESGNLKFDTSNRRFYIKGVEYNLTAKEYDVLELLVTNPGKVYTREELLKIVWGIDSPGDERTVDVHIRRLREKIEVNPSDPEYVHTKWGVGYFYKG